MLSPYGLEVTESCQNCKIRSKGSFCQLSPAALRAFDAIKHPTTYPRGAVLYVEGEESRGIFVLCQGRAKLTLSSSDGKTMILRIVEPGEVLGLNATLSGQPYEATAEVLHPCQVNFVRREDFLRFLREHSDASLGAAQILSNSYQAACGRIRTLGLSRSALGKLARVLLDWSSEGEETKQGTRVKLSLTHQEIAQVIGTSRETVTRGFAEFKNRHLAAFHGSTLMIQNKAALESLVSP